MKKKYKLISIFDDQDEIIITPETNESPEEAALKDLGWYLIPMIKPEESFK